MSKTDLVRVWGLKLLNLTVRMKALVADRGRRTLLPRSAPGLPVILPIPAETPAGRPLDAERAGRFICEAWRLALGRVPSDQDLAYLVQRLTAGDSPVDFLLELVTCEEAVGRRAGQETALRIFVPPGHFYSPIVDPSELRARSFSRRSDGALPGVEINFAAMEAFFECLVEHQAGLDFPDRESPSHRYFFANAMYGIGDALILACMIRHFGPRRIIEVGSGFSSAVILDTLDRTPDLATRCTFIEPYTDRLDALLRPADLERVRIIRSGIQTVPLETFSVLEAGDILFLDTTHISKTGSDVNHELFEILPRLASGVIVHFHDVFAGFEYPDEWIFDENRSWNEQYVLRAFLMFNTQFEIIYANDAFVASRPATIKTLCPRILENGGGGLWLRRR